MGSGAVLLLVTFAAARRLKSVIPRSEPHTSHLETACVDADPKSSVVEGIIARARADRGTI
jgi:hypothetical protein